MVKRSTNYLDTIFVTLSDPTRRSVLQRLSRGTPMNVSEIAEPYDISLPAVSKHLKVLESSQMIYRVRKGREYYFALNPAPLREAFNFVSYYKNFWESNLTNLENYLGKEVSVDE